MQPSLLIKTWCAVQQKGGVCCGVLLQFSAPCSSDCRPIVVVSISCSSWGASRIAKRLAKSRWSSWEKITSSGKSSAKRSRLRSSLRMRWAGRGGLCYTVQKGNKWTLYGPRKKSCWDMLKVYVGCLSGLISSQPGFFVKPKILLYFLLGSYSTWRYTAVELGGSI